VAAAERVETARALAGEFVEEYFDGSLSDLVLSLLGSRKIKPDDVQKLRKLLDEHAARRGPRRKKP
jgi:predicted transcriptional regulator